MATTSTNTIKTLMHFCSYQTIMNRFSSYTATNEPSFLVLKSFKQFNFIKSIFILLEINLKSRDISIKLIESLYLSLA